MERRYFPWRLLLRFVVGQGIVVILLLIASGLAWRPILIFLLLFGLASAWLAWGWLAPLGRMISRAQRLLRGELKEDEVPEEWTDSEESEWFELETTLFKLQADLKQKREALAREQGELATLTEAISDAIVAVDVDGAPLFYNSKFMLLFGGKGLPENQLRIGEIFRGPELLGAFHAALHEERAQSITLPLHSGSPAESVARFYSISISPLRRRDSKNSSTYGAVAVFHDISELKRAEQIRIDFVANVSHELRSPLTSIKGYIDTLREDLRQGRTDQAGQFIDVISKNSTRLMNLMNDLLDLSALESGGREGELQKAYIETNEVTSRIVSTIQSEYTDQPGGRRSVDVIFDEKEVWADPRRLEQVLSNLLENAFKYATSGTPLSLRWEGDAHFVRLRLRDQGPGLSPEHVSRLFERFYRVDKARARSIGGTGLGLAIVKHIVQAHGGAVWVTSEMGKGSEFVCQFPRE